MEIVYYTIAAIVLYLVSDFILNHIETRMGKRLPNRSLIFFVIIAVLAVSSFGVLEAVFRPPEATAKNAGENAIAAPIPTKEKRFQDLPPPKLPESKQPAIEPDLGEKE